MVSLDLQSSNRALSKDFNFSLEVNGSGSFLRCGQTNLFGSVAGTNSITQVKVFIFVELEGR